MKYIERVRWNIQRNSFRKSGFFYRLMQWVNALQELAELLERKP